MIKTAPVAISELPAWADPPEAVEALYRDALKSFSHKVIVLDDDPTGTQTVHGVPVYTDWSREAVLACFQDGAPVSYILTNSRGFTAMQTELVHREIAVRIGEAAAQAGKDYVLIGRGDSTLRGHWPLEMQVLAEGLSQIEGRSFDGEVILPAFMEGGRYTFGNIHYVKEGGWLVPVGQSEFAKDRTFGYQSSALTDWCEEKTNGRYPAETCICVDLEEIRALRVDEIAAQLATARNFEKIIVNAVCYEDLKVFCAACVKALREGKRFLFRTAASWVKVLGGIPDKDLLTHEELVSGTDFGGIILVGSYVNKTTRQLEMLRNSTLPLRYVEFRANLVRKAECLQAEVDRVVSEAEECIRQGVTVVVYTSRDPVDTENLSKDEKLQMSVAISDAVTSIVGRLQVRPAFIVAKGGITSSDVGVKALGVKRARVMGQILPGIPVWMIGEESKFPRMPYVIFPGNVGEDSTLLDAVSVLMEPAKNNT